MNVLYVLKVGIHKKRLMADMIPWYEPDNTKSIKLTKGFGKKFNIHIILVYLNGNNAAEGENNIKYANSYPMNWTVKNWFTQDIFESLW